MEIADLTTLLGNYAFPIVCVIAMFFMWNKERIDHKEEVTKMTEAVNNNTVVLKQILIKLGVNDD